MFHKDTRAHRGNISFNLHSEHLSKLIQVLPCSRSTIKARRSPLYGNLHRIPFPNGFSPRSCFYLLRYFLDPKSPPFPCFGRMCLAHDCPSKTQNVTPPNDPGIRRRTKTPITRDPSPRIFPLDQSRLKQSPGRRDLATYPMILL